MKGTSKPASPRGTSPCQRKTKASATRDTACTAASRAAGAIPLELFTFTESTLKLVTPERTVLEQAPARLAVRLELGQVVDEMEAGVGLGGLDVVRRVRDLDHGSVLGAGEAVTLRRRAGLDRVDVGDDATDEEAFAALPPGGLSVRVAPGPASRASC